MSWNISRAQGYVPEPVSLLVRLWVEIRKYSLFEEGDPCQPPCEAVSWNACKVAYGMAEAASASLWGCELKCLKVNLSYLVSNVSLLVRLWVEMLNQSSTSPPVIVSLLVRLWVEILISFLLFRKWFVSLLVRLWVEISSHTPNNRILSCQPPCEAVSWNIQYSNKIPVFILSASLWGCELKCNKKAYSDMRKGQPPCEAVSWNTISR